jgi:hemin uptake protein HemP
MTVPSGGKLGEAPTHAAGPAPTTRSIVMSGNRLDSRELFAVEREIIIAHGEDTYRLRLTSQNKLILTK